MKHLDFLLFILNKWFIFKEGTQLPDSTLFEDNPGKQVKIRELFAGKKGLLVGVPGLVFFIYRYFQHNRY